ncbi:MAG: possible cytochrome P450 hydroxylase superfamily proteins [uncultured Thiotrichaceae bacterium]|uniref:Possible cytochrome P450 hydroxylase superfamily proteins n=1 Tax=uncultured Thiotrichaceae bacterium TaxID=298394 RepID=A0A6S6S6N7_9GAMM|nr:MAG: possible cytochrome P450 hydroxylase superfamily proteins [uncultured Thiotrichaceae bacterium]
MSVFEPTYPPRHAEPLSAFKTWQYARKDLLSIWAEEAFELQLMGSKILNQWVYIANAPDVVKHVFVSNHQNYLQKSPQMRKALEPLLGDGLFISDGETWHTRRKIQTPLFTAQHVIEYSRIMVDTALERAEAWAKKSDGDTLEVLPEMAMLTAEIICRTLFGAELGKTKSSEVVKAFSEYQESIEQMALSEFLGIPDWVPVPGTSMRKARKAAKRIHKVVDDIIENADYAEDDFTMLAQFLKLNQRDEAITREGIRNEIIVLFMAGHETTANTLAWTWYLISQAPDVESKMHAELGAICRGQTPSYEHYSQLTYLRAILDEAMRLYPPVPILSRQAADTDYIRGREIPKGAIVMVVPWLLHRHESLWEHPNQFIPERFLEGGSAFKQDKYTYVPFSIGPRVCLGKYFGQVELVLTMATLAQKFRLSLPPNTEVTHDCRLTLRPKDNLPMQLFSVS